MPTISLKELQTIQQLEADHRKAIKAIGSVHSYLNSVAQHPVYSNQPDAQAVARKALELFGDAVLD